MNATECAAISTEKVDNGPSPGSLKQLLREYAVLIKLRITAMVVFTAWCGAYLATDGRLHNALTWSIVAALAGIGLVAAGTAAANQVVERRTDAKMRRTAQRPLVTGAISVPHAIAATVVMIVGGTILIAFTANPLTAILTLLTSISYIAVYTPLKRVTPLCTAVGAVPGAMPILLGWVAVRGQMDWQAALLFAILFFWQFPHFHAISLLYVEDYRRGEIRMLPVVEPDGVSTRRRIVAYSIALVVATLIPTLTHMSGILFGVAAVVLGATFLMRSFPIGGTWDLPEQPEAKILARRILIDSVIYLPLLLGILLLDHSI